MLDQYLGITTACFCVSDLNDIIVTQMFYAYCLSIIPVHVSRYCDAVSKENQIRSCAPSGSTFTAV